MRRIKSASPKGYVYELLAPVGRNFDVRFKPTLSPKDMMRLGVFDGAYFEEDQKEYPASWFVGAKLSKRPDPSLNYFGVHASQSLSVWRAKGWIWKYDPRGWFQWYCRYYLGRRVPKEDERQIRRWLAMVRHVAQVRANCTPGDVTCRPRQRQALLHWAIDSRNL